MVDLAAFCKELSLKNDGGEDTTFPCNTIPVARNMRFFGRQENLQRIEAFLRPSEERPGMLSFAIWGLGGVGKSQVALEYACSKQADLDTVIWVEAETEIILQQGLSHAALNCLKLPGTEPQTHKQNAIIMMDWLKSTSQCLPPPFLFVLKRFDQASSIQLAVLNVAIGRKWLLIYDNVESARVFDLYWPAAHRGSILITTRRRSLTTQPVNDFIELETFASSDGAQFLLHLLQDREIRKEDPEFQTAIEISTRLGGLSLAISQIAALITARNMSLDKFIKFFDKYQGKMLRERKPGWKYPGYNHAIDTVWDISFDALETEGRVLLSVLSYLSPDSVPLQLFDGSVESLKRPSLAFCADIYKSAFSYP